MPGTSDKRLVEVSTSTIILYVVYQNVNHIFAKHFQDIISVIENHESNNKYLELYDEHAF